MILLQIIINNDLFFVYFLICDFNNLFKRKYINKKSYHTLNVLCQDKEIPFSLSSNSIYKPEVLDKEIESSVLKEWLHIIHK